MNEGEAAGGRRRQIMEIAAQIFARKGYRGTSMRDIGEAAGVLGGSLYHHIKSKDALFVELHHAALALSVQEDARALSVGANHEGARVAGNVTLEERIRHPPPKRTYADDRVSSTTKRRTEHRTHRTLLHLRWLVKRHHRHLRRQLV